MVVAVRYSSGMGLAPGSAARQLTPSLPAPGPLGVAPSSTHDDMTTELADAVLAAAAGLGLETRSVGPDDDQSSLGALLAVGYPPVFLPILRQPAACRRLAWVGEELPAVGTGPRGRAGRIGVGLFSAAARLPRGVRHFGPVRFLGRPFGAEYTKLELAHHLRDALQVAGLVERFVAASKGNAEILRLSGATVECVPFGYHESVHGPLVPPTSGRDVELLTLGGISGPRSVRRSTWISRWRAAGLDIASVETIWGPPRSALLARTKIVIDVHRVPGTFAGTRLVMALAAGAAVVSEPMKTPDPFVPGVHFISAPVENLGDEARALLADEPRRRLIVDAGQELLRGDLAMENCLRQVLALLQPPAGH